MNADDLAALNEEIAAMARAGLPLDQGLASLAREMRSGHLQRVTEAIALDLRAGCTLPEALQRQGRRLPPYYAGLLTAGIRSGRLGEVLATVAAYARTLADVRALLVEAFFYPTLVFLFASALFGFALWFVLPQMEQAFAGFNVRLPFLTTLALSLGRRPVETVLLPIAWLVCGLVLLRLTLGMTRRGRILAARAVYALPVLGTLLRSARLAAFTDLLAILMDQSVPMPEAFLLAGEACSDPIMAATAREVHQELCQGLPLGQVLRGRGLVPEWVSWMTSLGEKRGHLAASLHQVAEMYRRSVQLRAAMLRSVLPPFLILMIGGVFGGFFVTAMMLPVVKMIEGLTR